MGASLPDLGKHLGDLLAAVGGLGAASSALADATKIGRDGGISNAGFFSIEEAIKQFYPDAIRAQVKHRTMEEGASADDGDKLLDILHGNWINGMALADQREVARSLIKLHLSSANALQWAKTTKVDPQQLVAAAENMARGVALDDAMRNAYGRFDVYLTALLDEGYQKADQQYRNGARVLASVFAILLAIIGGWTVFGKDFDWQLFGLSLLCGIFAVPLTPVSKDLTSALAAAVQVAQSIKK